MNESVKDVIDTSAAHLGVGEVEKPRTGAELPAFNARHELDAVKRFNERGVEDVKPEFLKLRDNALDGFRFGAAFDYRVRLAADMLVNNPSITDAVLTLDHSPTLGDMPGKIASFALDVASELVRLAIERKLVEPFKEFEHDTWLKTHLKRQTSYQFEGQKVAQKLQAEAARMPQAIGKVFNQ